MPNPSFKDALTRMTCYPVSITSPGTSNEMMVSWEFFNKLDFSVRPLTPPIFYINQGIDGQLIYSTCGINIIWQVAKLIFHNYPGTKIFYVNTNVLVLR